MIGTHTGHDEIGENPMHVMEAFRKAVEAGKGAYFRRPSWPAGERVEVDSTEGRGHVLEVRPTKVSMHPAAIMADMMANDFEVFSKAGQKIT